jgi:hypothetical protein
MREEGGRETGDEGFINDCGILAFGAYGRCKRCNLSSVAVARRYPGQLRREH